MNTTTIWLFIIIVSNAGGQGKTTLARLLKALFEINGAPVQLLDADAGNSAAMIVDPTSAKVGWGVQSVVNPDIVRAYSGKHVILDLGANTMASAREIADAIPDLIREFENAGYHSLALLPVTPNKPGAADAVVKLGGQLPAENKWLVLNDSDGTGNFEKGEFPFPIAKLEHLMPGLVAYVNATSSRSFGDAAVSPSDDQQIAARHIAKWMGDFAKQLPFQEIFAQSARVLDQIPSPAKTMFRVTAPELTKDTVMASYERRSVIFTGLNKYGWHAAGLRRVAEQLEQSATQT